MLGVVQDFVKDYENGYEQADAGCLECTSGTTPNDRNTGPCAYHRAKAILARLA